MILIYKKSAVAIFYYLTAVDGEVGENELSKFDLLGEKTDPDNFKDYRDEVVAVCEAQIRKASADDNYYDIISEGVDSVIYLSAQNAEECIPSRLLLWNLLVMSYANGEYAPNERRLIKHISRLIEFRESVFLEMEQLIKTSICVDTELEKLQKSTRPYNEIQPVVEQIQKRRENILKCATELIEDETIEPIEALTVKQDIFDKAKDKINEKVAPAAKKIVGDIKEKTSDGLEKAKSGISNLLKGKKSKETAQNDSKKPKLSDE